MKPYSEYILATLLLGLLAAMYAYLGVRVAAFAGGLALVWLFIILVLATRPPGIPELVLDENLDHEQHVVRKDVLPKLPWRDRLRLALGVATGACLLLWISLALLGQ